MVGVTIQYLNKPLTKVDILQMTSIHCTTWEVQGLLNGIYYSSIPTVPMYCQKVW